MCGRVALFSPPARLARFLDATLAAGLDPEGSPRWNVGPQRHLLGASETDGARVLDHYRWGLVPSWAKDPSLATRLFNARGETVAEKPSFRSAFAKRPCVIPVDGFYEWDHRVGHSRQPYYFARADHEPLLLAGLYEHWRNPEVENEEPLATCTIITTTPSDDMAQIHDRMPVVLTLDDVETWLNIVDHPADERALLLVPAASGTLTHHAVSASVGSIKNEGPHLIEPAETDRLF